MSFLKVLLLGCLSVVLAGCLTVNFVEDYDPVLDQGLASYQTDIAEFLALAKVNAKSETGRYGHESVQAFYARSGAQLGALLDRSMVLDTVGRCPIVGEFGDVLDDILDKSIELVDAIQQNSDAQRQVVVTLNALKLSKGITEGNCTVVMLKVAQANHLVLQLIHEENDVLSPVIVDIAGPILAQSTRIALRNEVAKKRRD